MLMTAPRAAGLALAITIKPPEVLVADAAVFVAAPDLLNAWLTYAERGDRAVYARTRRIDRGDATAELARALAGKGLITLQQQRHGASLYDYIARRTHLSVIAAAPPAPREESLAPDLRLVLDHLSRLADQGAPCSSNRGIARACGLRDAEAARYRLRQLRGAGAIIVAPVPVEPGRVVTIVETGARTGLIGRGQ
jgi:hypothetical protein